jgi:hypothetical protein
MIRAYFWFLFYNTLEIKSASFIKKVGNAWTLQYITRMLNFYLNLLCNLDTELMSLAQNCNGFLCFFFSAVWGVQVQQPSHVCMRASQAECLNGFFSADIRQQFCGLALKRGHRLSLSSNHNWIWDTHRLRTPPRSDALRHSGGDRRRCTSPTVTLYLDVELSSDRRPGTLQNTSEGADAPERTMSLLFSLFRGFIPAHMEKKHAVLNAHVSEREKFARSKRKQNKKVTHKIDFWRNALGMWTGLI